MTWFSFERHSFVDAATLGAVARSGMANGHWIEINPATTEPALLWLDRLSRELPEWRKAVGEVLLAIGQGNEGEKQAVADFFQNARSAPQFEEIAQWLVAGAGPRSPLMALERELPDLTRRAAGARPVGVVVLAPRLEYLVLGSADDLLAEAKRSVECGKPRIGGTHVLDWLSDTADRTAWVRGELAEVLSTLLQSDVEQERKAAIGLAIQRPAAARIARVFQELLLRNPSWLDSAFTWRPGDRALGDTLRTHVAWLARPQR